MMDKTVQELAVFLHGTVENDNPQLKITGVNGLAEAGPGDISFAVPPHVEHCHLSRAGVLVLGHADPLPDGRPVIRVDNPRAAFAALLALFRAPEEIERTVSPLAFVSAEAKIGHNVAVQPFAVIEAGAEIGSGSVIYPHAYIGKRVKLGCDCVIYPGVTIREDCVLGDRVILQAGAVIGGEGFGYITQGGRHSKVLQTGNVVLQDDVEVGNNSCIDRATAGSTIVGRGTKIDNLVHLGHNDVLGENCLVVAHVGISGSVTEAIMLLLPDRWVPWGISPLATTAFLAAKRALPITFPPVRSWRVFRPCRTKSGCAWRRTCAAWAT